MSGKLRYYNGSEWEQIAPTKEEYDGLKNDFKTHEAESASKHIKESGTNVNGSYIKFDDGTIMCFRNVTHDFNVKTEVSYPFPASILTLLGGGGMYGATSVDARRDAFANTSITCNYGNWRISARTTFAASDLIYLFAIGRWK